MANLSFFKGAGWPASYTAGGLYFNTTTGGLRLGTGSTSTAYTELAGGVEMFTSASSTAPWSGVREKNFEIGSSTANPLNSLNCLNGQYNLVIGKSNTTDSSFGIIDGANCYITPMEGSGYYPGNYSIAMGEGSTIYGSSYSLAWGETSPSAYPPEASGIGYCIAIGRGVLSSGYHSAAFGDCKVFGDASEDDAVRTTSSGEYSVAIGEGVQATGDYAIASGIGVQATGRHSIAIGEKAEDTTGDTQAVGSYSAAVGVDAQATGDYSTAIGNNAHASSTYSTAIGDNVVTNSTCSVVRGIDSKIGFIASGETGSKWNLAWGGSNNISVAQYKNSMYSLAFGYNNTITDGSYALAFGSNNNLNASSASSYSIAFGHDNTVNSGSVCIGSNLIGKNGTVVCGKNNIYTDFDLFEVGGGSNISNRSTAFRVTSDGVYGNAYNSSGADYAEMWELNDASLKTQDLRGLFVTVTENNKIRLATNEDDYILGIISSTPSIVGDTASNSWAGKYMKDVYGNILYETVHVEECVDESTNATVPAHDITVEKINPEYDATQTYISRENRPEWQKVGLLGKLIVNDDGTCIPGHYCSVSATSGATASTRGENTWRVLERLDASHIRIMYR